MNRSPALILCSLVALLATASYAFAGAPHAVPYPGLAPAGQTAQSTPVLRPQAAFGTAATYTDPVAAALAIGTRLVDLQSDVTEDNAGNGNPDLPLDGNDGGWDWVVTGQTKHANNGSYENLYGPIARGLVEAAIFTGNTRLGVGAGDVFAGISRTGTGLSGYPYYAIWDADIATAYVRWAAHTGNSALADTIKDRHADELLWRGGAGGRARTVCLGRRGQGLPGMWPWDIHLLSNDCDALAGAFPASATAYLTEVDSVSQVVMDDMNGLLGIGGWSPTAMLNYHELGIAGALRVFDLSPRLDDDALATVMRDSLVAEQLADGSWGVTYGGVLYGQDAQTTAYAVLALMEYSARHNDAVARHAAIRGQQWLLGMIGSGGIVNDGGGEYAETAAEVAQALLVGDEVGPVAPGTCVTPAHACVQVPVVFNRVDTTPVRGFSVTLTMSGNLALCGAGIVQGTYLSSVGGTNYQVLSLGGGVYTVDCAILGGTTCATGSGTLFTLNLASVAPSGTGTVTVNSVLARDCNNAPVGAVPGAPATIVIDNTAPAAVTGLTASQVKSGNGSDGTTAITLTFTAPVDAAVVEVYRAAYGQYPEYDDASGTVPATPGAYPPGGSWTLTGVTASGQTDEPAGRDFWYYVAYAQDACGNWSGVSNKTGGTLNYHLGDVTDGTTACVGDNLVATADVSLLGTNYGATLGAPMDPLGCLDVGPTTDYSVDARPTTDNQIQFEDLMMFAINYGRVSSPEVIGELAVAGRDELSVEGPSRVGADESFTVAVRMAGSGTLQGVSARLGWDASVATPVAVEAGELMGRQNGVVFSAVAGGVDAAVLGTGRTIAGEGVLATVTFRALAAGDPKVVLGPVDGRDPANRRVALTGVGPQVPTETSLSPAAPNPFAGATALSFSLAQSGPVELGIYSVDGRRVRTLVSGVREAQSYRVSWDGRDDGGRSVASGVYFARLSTAAGRFHRTVVLAK